MLHESDSTMNHNQLRQVDLNLLVVLDVLLRKRSVSAAAGELNLIPSAVSHALGRLRKLFDDELLVRDGQRIRPTHRAEGSVEFLPRLLQAERAQALCSRERRAGDIDPHVSSSRSRRHRSTFAVVAE